MPRAPHWLALALGAVAALVAITASCSPEPAAPASRALPWDLRAGGWRSDGAWHDGKAEECVYEATRTIYGRERRYLATAYTNKQRMDPATTVKSATDEGVEVFKHHWSERVPTESYDYDFSTAVFLRASDLGAFKLTVATQEDCGASFKQLWRVADEAGERLRWFDSVYLPGAGNREGAIELGAEPSGLHVEDGLTLLLRDLAAAGSDAPPSAPLRLVPAQKTTRRASFEPVRRSARVAGRERLDLPVGSVEATRVDLHGPEGATVASYWFAVERDPPWLGALVAYEGPEGVTYRLRSIERTAYWERGS